MSSNLLGFRSRLKQKTAAGLCGFSLVAALTFVAAPAALADGGAYEVAFQGSNGNLWTLGSDPHGDWGLSMMSGTSPSIIGLGNNEGYEVAFQGSNGDLWVAAL